MFYDIATRVGVDADDQPVLVKVASSPPGRERLRREAAVLEGFQHPNVAELLAFDETAGSATLTQRWAGSQTLGGLSPMAVDQAAGVLASLAATVADLHDSGLAHGRIDGSHVVVAADGRPILCGLAEASSAPAAQAEDVAALGELLRTAVGTDLEFDPIPERSRFRPRLRRQRWSGYRARALLNLADQATAEQPEHRPTARQLAASLATTVPTAQLPTPSGSPPATGALLTGARPASPKAPELDPEEPDQTDGSSSTGEAATTLTPATMTEPTALADSRSATGALEALDEERWAALWGVGDGDPRPDLLGLRDPDPADASAPGEPNDGGLPRSTQPERRSARRVPVKAAAALVGVGLIAAGWYGLHRGSADEHGSAHRRTATVHTTPAPQESKGERQPSKPPSTGGRNPNGCSPAAGATADVNHDGCPETVSVQGRVITAGAEQYEVGRPGDDVVVGDWQCDGQVTPAVLRPSTGEVFVFGGWASRSRPLTVAATDTTAGADSLRAEHRGRCDVLVATRPGHAPVEIPVTGS